MGYHPEIILAGRRLNDSMGEYVASQVVKLMIKKGIAVNSSSLLMLGITFKENCPDVRNTKIIDVVHSLTDYGIDVVIYDPWASPQDVAHEYNLTVTNEKPMQKFDAVVLGVAHNEFKTMHLQDFKKEHSIIYDVKGILGNQADGKL
jgi:UDP-N-acetyl-D-galactosamine dehydrogenase